MTERASKLSTDPQQQHFVHVSHRTEHKSCLWPNNFGVRTACAVGFLRSGPHSLEDISKCKLMFTYVKMMFTYVLAFVYICKHYVYLCLSLCLLMSKCKLVFMNATVDIKYANGFLVGF